MKTGTEEVIPGHSHIFTDTIDQVIMTYAETIPGHDIGIIATTPRVAHDPPVPHTEGIAIDPTMTHHIDPTADHPCTEVPHHTTPEIEVNHIHIHPTMPQDKICIGHTCTPGRAQSKPHHKRNTRVNIEDPHTVYYNSDDHSSDSGEETDHLN